MSKKCQMSVFDCQRGLKMFGEMLWWHSAAQSNLVFILTLQHTSKPWLVQLSYELFFSYSTFLLKYSWFTMLCHSLLHSKVTYLHTYIHCFYILFYYDLSRDTKYSLLCYTLESCHLRILNVIYQPQICISFPSFPHP